MFFLKFIGRGIFNLILTLIGAAILGKFLLETLF